MDAGVLRTEARVSGAYPQIPAYRATFIAAFGRAVAASPVLSVVFRGPQNERADNDRCLRFRRTDNRLRPAASGGTANNSPRWAFRPGSSTDYSICLQLCAAGSAAAGDRCPCRCAPLGATADYSPPVLKLDQGMDGGIKTHPFIASKVTLRRTKGVAPTHPVGARPFAHQLCCRTKGAAPNTPPPVYACWTHH